MGIKSVLWLTDKLKECYRHGEDRKIIEIKRNKQCFILWIIIPYFLSQSSRSDLRQLSGFSLCAGHEEKIFGFPAAGRIGWANWLWVRIIDFICHDCVFFFLLTAEPRLKKKRKKNRTQKVMVVLPMGACHLRLGHLMEVFFNFL